MDGTAQTWIVGRLTEDPQRKDTKTGATLVTFSVAVNRSRKVGDEWQDEVHFFDVVRFGKAAETTLAKLRKGDEVTISGRLDQNRWEAQDGSKRSKVQVIAERMWSPGFYREYEARPAKESEDFDFSDEDDIPF